MTKSAADLINLCKEKCIKPMPCLCDKCFEGVPIEEWTTEPLFPPLPPAVRAENMLRECQRDKWQMAPHPILRLRGNDHG